MTTEIVFKKVLESDEMWCNRYFNYKRSCTNVLECDGRMRLSVPVMCNYNREHENLSSLSVLIYIKLYKEKGKKTILVKNRAKWEPGLTAVQLKWDPPVYCPCVTPKI